ncbi:hypothetical protein V2J09_013430 [Rumex salicifolius]
MAENSKPGLAQNFPKPSRVFPPISLSSTILPLALFSLKGEKIAEERRESGTGILCTTISRTIRHNRELPFRLGLRSVKPFGLGLTPACSGRISCQFRLIGVRISFIPMVHAIGSVKMAVMARSLCGGRVSQNIAEESGRQKRVSQYVHKQLREADEANLLDEKDMHVFDLKPMTDPLCLDSQVCCHACKKPVKTSQYAAHAELCRSLMPTNEFLSDRNGDAGPKRPPKMERKRSKAAGNKVSPIVTQEHYELVDPSDAAASKSRFMGHNGPMSSLTVDTKGGPLSTNLSSTHGNCLTSPSAKDPAATTTPLSKRPKLLAADMVQSSEGLATEGDICNVSRNVPAPLATKIYYSQRNNHLRAALSYMYHEGATGHCSDEASPKVSCFKKSSMHTLLSLNPNQTIGQHSGVNLGQMGGHQSRNYLPNQLIPNDSLPSQMRTSMYRSKPKPLITTPGPQPD